MDFEEALNFKIFSGALIFFLVVFMCSVGYKVFKGLAFPGTEAETTIQEDAEEVDAPSRHSKKTSLPACRYNAIRDNPFYDFTR